MNRVRSHAVAAAFVIAALGPSLGLAQSTEEIFARGNEAFLAERYDDAIEQYERLLDAHVVDPDVEFNLATAQARLGRLGAATQHFERTLRLRPSDAEAEAGLQAARRILAERRAASEGVGEIIVSGGLSDAMYRGFTEPVLAWGLLALVVALLLSVVWFRRARRRLRVGLALLLVVESIATTAFAVGVMTKRGVFRDGAEGIVLVDRAALREGPDERHASRGQVREGDAATLLETDETGHYIRVRIGDERGWVARDAVGRVTF